jgi:biotin transport system substrate-specific component
MEVQKLQAQQSIFSKILLSTIFAVMTGAAAQIKIPLPFSPVPVTGQTLVVLLSPLLIGRLSGVSQIIYVLVGIAGMPWFAGLKGGLSIVIGPTGGYLIGFVIASFVLGSIFEQKNRSSTSTLLWLAFANFGIIYAIGLLQLYWWFAIKGSHLTLIKLLSMGAIPFIPGDLTKILLAAGIYSIYKKLK